ncbi:RES family NAD+ phosphorylase [Silvimonas sp.]|uniref:RES family NAD+ phosphorylase n=1 Tax=Silvimonas sp. TaxID=2650811 RepID=UPI0028430FEE|nr:RES family NAD+ phosphorylase [Silvimonas sp.]MDR3429497.1 RES family NAD+ phosphorylase [Silvimonas sp.]
MIPCAAESNAEVALKPWRSVETQREVATLALVDNDPDEQALLEAILDDNKPPLPTDAAKLHYLLSTPFRYPAHPPNGSRFVRPGALGMLYAAENKLTAMAESGYWQHRFNRASAGLRDTHITLARTLFQVSVAGKAIDLLKPPFAEHASLWNAPDNYTATHELGSAARENSDVDLILYESVRDPDHGVCVAVVNVRAFKRRKPLASEEWHLTLQGPNVLFRRGVETISFRFEN